jgi:hypothetical protein
MFSKIIYTIMNIGTRKFIRIFKRAMKPTASGGRFFIPNVKNIYEAGKTLEIFLNSKSISFKNRGKNV